METKELKFYDEKAEEVLHHIMKTMSKKQYVCINNGFWDDDEYNRGVFYKRLTYDRRGKFDKIHLYIKHENASKGYSSNTQFIFKFYEEKLKGLFVELRICELTRTKINKIIDI